MRNILIICALVLFAIAAWYGVWTWMVSGDVARIEKTIAYHNTRIKNANTSTQLRANKVHAVGFPFHFRVRVEEPTLSSVTGDETYSLSFDYVELTPRDASEGSYVVTYPNLVHALYAKSGSAPEIYTASADQPIALLVRALGNSQQCSGMPGAQRCPDAAPDAPIISLAAGLPAQLTLSMTLNGQTKQALFQLPSVQVPIYQTIPEDWQSPLTLFVGVLREALVYRTQ